LQEWLTEIRTGLYTSMTFITQSKNGHQHPCHIKVLDYENQFYQRHIDKPHGDLR